MFVVMTFITTVVLVTIFSVTSANANPVEKFQTWLVNEKNKTIEYQQKSWADSKIQFAKTKDTILKLFKNQEKDEPHN